jgi:hypothetical protein
VGRLHDLFHYVAFNPTTTTRTASPWDSRPLGDPVFRHRGTYLERLGLPPHTPECTRCSSPIHQGVPRTKVNSWLPVASVYRRATDECEIPPLDIGVQAIPALAISLRRCRAPAYTSSAVLRFTNVLLSPRPCGSRLVVHLGVICPELRPPLVAILSVRDTKDTAHSFTP